MCLATRRQVEWIRKCCNPIQAYSGRTREMNGMILSAPLLALSLQGQPQFVKAPIRRLPPKTFRQLPTAVVESLEARKCLIPQIWHDETPHNVIRGSFTGAKRDEWAVLCSRTRTSSILIFRGLGEIGRPFFMGFTS